MLETLLGSKLRARVLAWLFTHPDQRYFVRQLTSLLGEDSTNVSRELARLEKTGILTSTLEGRQKYYQANRNTPVFEELHGLMVKTAGVADVLRRALTPASGQMRVGFIYGSFAAGTERRESDIDVMVVGRIPFGDVVDLLAPAEEQLHRQVNVVDYSVAEFGRRVREKQPFVAEVLRGPKVFLIGDADELGRLVAGRALSGAPGNRR